VAKLFKLKTQKDQYLDGTFYVLGRGSPGFLGTIRQSFEIARESVVDFGMDYRGQTTVELRLAHYSLGRSIENSEAEALETWTNWLENNLSKIKVLKANWASDQRLLEAIATQPQIERLHLERRVKITDLSVLSLMPKLTTLHIADCPPDLDFSPLKKVTSLRHLHVHSRKPLRFDTLSGLTQLDSLWIGSGIDPAFDGHAIKVDDLEFLRPLKQLKRIRIDAVRPNDKDFSVLLTLKNLEQGWYVYFRGQNPSAEEMAKAHPAFVAVYENKLRIDEMLRRSRQNE